MPMQTDPFFALATYDAGGRPFTAVVRGDKAFALPAVGEAWMGTAAGARSGLSAGASIEGLLEDWPRQFEALQGLVDFIASETPRSDRFAGAVYATDALRPLPPVRRPSKILNCAANYSGHLAEMRQYTQTLGAIAPEQMYRGDKSTGDTYLFLKAPSSLIGAHDDIVMPAADSQLDWEVELGVVIGPTARSLPAERALEHVAGYMTFNDISCRDQLFRTDRPTFRTDWLSSKSWDTFGPSGPCLVPRAFVPNHGALRLVLKVNGETKQDGPAGDMIYSPEEQVAYASRRMTLLPGDIFATGTLAGVGQGTGKFLRPGDLVEAEVVGLGAHRNRVVGPAG